MDYAYVIALLILAALYTGFAGLFYYLGEKRQARHPEYPELTISHGVHSLSPAQPFRHYLRPRMWLRGADDCLREIHST